MAVIKAISSKAGIGQAINYVTKRGKTEERLVSGLHCQPETVKDEMQATKELWGKTGGRTYKHFVQSYHAAELITPEQAHRNALELAKNTPAWQGFEVLVSTHKDKSHIHTHFIVNSVSFQDGRKLQWSSADLRDLKKRCNIQSREQGLHVPEKGKTFEGQEREETAAWKKDTYQLLKDAEQGTVKSYVQNIALAILDCREQAVSREDFLRLMEQRGYRTEWKENHKYITWTDKAREEAGEKMCKIRNNKLEKYYNMDFGKEGLEREFAVNARTEQAREQLRRGTDRTAEPENYRIGGPDTEAAIREARAAIDLATAKEQDSRARRADREIKRQRSRTAGKRKTQEQEQRTGRSNLGRKNRSYDRGPEL